MKKYKSTILPIALTAVLAIATSAPSVFAVEVGAKLEMTAGVNQATSTKMEVKTGMQADANARITERAEKEIDRRVDALNKLSVRINEIQKLSTDQKTSLSSDIQAQISALGDLKMKVLTHASDTAALKEDAKSITGSYRIFALVMPQAAIIAAADRALAIVDAMAKLSNKLQIRITSSTGFDASTTASTFADFTIKLNDAKTKAQTAIDEVKTLKPDMANQTQFQANLNILKDARTKIQAAQQDLVAARKDAGIIVKALISFDASLQPLDEGNKSKDEE